MTFTRNSPRALAVAGALLALAVGPAAAAGNSVTVAVGGSSAPGSHSITAATSEVVSWASPILAWSCTQAKVPPSPVSDVSSGLGVTDVLQIRALQFGGCVWPYGSILIELTTPASFRVTGPATSGSSDVVQGRIDDVTIRAKNAICDFTVSGSMRASLNEATQKLAVDESGFTGNLLISQVKGCLGQVQNGQAMNITMNLQLTSPDGAINISGS
ncbi:hypothetical protein QE370_001268 [Aeromicrobium sp. SORGH_AS981]|nr:hypothetical protein [Aeromicrobium sp. SORGH_AS_0981]